MVKQMSIVLEWLEHHRVTMWWLGSFSIVVFLGFLIAIPILIVRLPGDYFLNQAIPNHKSKKTVSLPRMIYRIFKNALGIIFILAGFGMLFLPGQGLLTLIIGISLLNIPGKHHLFLAILQQEKVMESMNRLRARFNKEAFQTRQ